MNLMEIDFSEEIADNAIASGPDEMVTNYVAEGRDIPYKTRKQAKDSQFLDPARRSFPILSCEDIPAAVHSWGRYKGSMTFDEFKAKLKRKASELGCTNIPKEWSSSDSKK
jgi:hypothetical protein